MIWWQGLIWLQPFFSEQPKARVFSWGYSQWRHVRSLEQVTLVVLLQDQGL